MGYQRLAAHILRIAAVAEAGVVEVGLADAPQVLRRTVVADDDLEVSISLPLDALEHLVKEPALVGGQEEGVF